MSLLTKNFAINDESYPILVFIDAENVIWFRGNDAAEILKYKRPQKAILDHVSLKYKKCWGVLKQDVGISQKKIQPTTMFITRSGLFQLILKSQKEEAFYFQEWVVGDVLPSIYEKGYYILPELQKQLTEAQNQLTLRDKQILEIKHLFELEHVKYQKIETQLAFLIKKITEQEPKVAIIPSNENAQEHFALLVCKKNSCKYMFIRTQKRRFNRTLAKNSNDYNPLLIRTILPNSRAILNEIKFILNNNQIPFGARNNIIVTTADILEMSIKLTEKNNQEIILYNSNI